MKFRFTTDATFEAEDIDDAFAKLGKHFFALECDGPETGYAPIQFIFGELRIEPVPL